MNSPARRSATKCCALWETFRPTVLWVTHNIVEAARLADRVIVLSARPGHVQAIVPIPQARPRDETTPESTAIIQRLRAVLRGGNDLPGSEGSAIHSDEEVTGRAPKL